MICKIKCPECGAAYRVDTDRLRNQTPLVRCRVCSHQWRLELEDLVQEPTAIRKVPPHNQQPGREPLVVTCPHCGGDVPQPEQPTSTGNDKPLILLVDDKSFFREYTREILGERYDYAMAASTTEALEMIDHCDPDLIILDLKLEGGPRDGHEILTRRSRKDTPVLVFTGESNFNIHSEDWSELEQLGARDILEKGINIRDSLLRKVRRLLGEV